MDTKVKRRGKCIPLIRKCLVGLLMAIIVAIPLATTCQAVNVSVVSADLTIDRETTYTNALTKKTKWDEITLDYQFSPNSTKTQYNLCTASNPKNITIIDYANREATSTAYYFDDLCGEIRGKDEGENEVYIRTYIEQITSGFWNESNYKSGIRISARIYIPYPTNAYGQTVQSLDINWFSNVESYHVLPCGTEVNVMYYVDEQDSSELAYWDGFQAGYEQMDASGLSATQTAFGVVSAPINAIASVIQSASNGWFNTPVGEISSWIFGILVIAGAILFIVKVVIGH